MKKKFLIIIGLIFCFAAGLLLFFFIKVNETNEFVNNIIIEDISIKNVKDGEYKGSCNAELVSAEVTVKVNNGSITEILLNSHNHGPGFGADEIISSILSKQSLNVDSISGASRSSKVIRKAVEEALKKGL